MKWKGQKFERNFIEQNLKLKNYNYYILLQKIKYSYIKYKFIEIKKSNKKKMKIFSFNRVIFLLEKLKEKSIKNLLYFYFIIRSKITCDNKK